jgi:hypothetical protein
MNLILFCLVLTGNRFIRGSEGQNTSPVSQHHDFTPDPPLYLTLHSNFGSKNQNCNFLNVCFSISVKTIDFEVKIIVYAVFGYSSTLRKSVGAAPSD